MFRPAIQRAMRVDSIALFRVAVNSLKLIGYSITLETHQSNGTKHSCAEHTVRWTLHSLHSIVSTGAGPSMKSTV